MNTIILRERFVCTANKNDKGFSIINNFKINKNKNMKTIVKIATVYYINSVHGYLYSQLMPTETLQVDENNKCHLFKKIISNPMQVNLISSVRHKKRKSQERTSESAHMEEIGNLEEIWKMMMDKNPEMKAKMQSHMQMMNCLSFVGFFGCFLLFFILFSLFSSFCFFPFFFFVFVPVFLLSYHLVLSHFCSSTYVFVCRLLFIKLLI